MRTILVILDQKHHVPIPTNFNGVTPRWFKLLQKIVLTNHVFSNRLKSEFAFEPQVFNDYLTLASIKDFQWNTG
ncbi:17578_t:CDS:2 [Funneliformis geosporum]|nr:17578_t:CDS:2 [Funneliformis geosporum]